MPETKLAVDIFPGDAENQRSILERIRRERIIDEVTIRALVETYQFSSLVAKQYTVDRLIDLLKIGALEPNKPPMKGVEFKAVDTDAPRLINGGVLMRHGG